MKYKYLIKKSLKKMLLTQTEFVKELCVSFALVDRWKFLDYRPTIKTKSDLSKLFKKTELRYNDEI